MKYTITIDDTYADFIESYSGGKAEEYLAKVATDSIENLIDFEYRKRGKTNIEKAEELLA